MLLESGAICSEHTFDGDRCHYAVIVDVGINPIEDSSSPRGYRLVGDVCYEEDLANKPIGPVDPAKCTAAGTGIAGGTAGAPSSFTVVTKDAAGRKVPTGGAQVIVKVSPGLSGGVLLLY